MQMSVHTLALVAKLDCRRRLDAICHVLWPAALLAILVNSAFHSAPFGEQPTKLVRSCPYTAPDAWVFSVQLLVVTFR